MYLRDVVCLESKSEIEYWSEVFYEKFKDIKIFHQVNPFLRFSQVLQFFNLYKEGFWFFIEDEAVLMSLGVEPREVLYWGNNYSAKGNRLKKTNWMLIKDMNTEHIKAVLDGNFINNLVYLKAFNDELKLRENESTTVQREIQKSY
jgi:hypothetical protein